MASNLLTRIVEYITNNGLNENFLKTCMIHMEKVLPMYDASDKCQEEYVNILLSNFFLQKIEFYPANRFKCRINESKWPIVILPYEVFYNPISVETRKFLFYMCLQTGDCLECRISAILPTEYQLRVIHKSGVARILEDLQITVTMRKRDIEKLPLSLREFQLNTLLRVIVIEKGKKEENEATVFVSVIDTDTHLSSLRPLGAIPDEQLPRYVLTRPSVKDTLTYTDFLSSERGFKNPLSLNGIMEGFGINIRGVNSFFPIIDSFKTYDSAQLEEIKMCDRKEFMRIALRDLAQGKFTYAKTAINKAIKLCPKPVNKEAKAELGKLNEIKGTIQISEVQPKLSRGGCEDLLKAINLDRTNESASINLSKEAFRIAMLCYKQKHYTRAAEQASMALKINDKNVEAHALLEYLKRKHPEAAVDCDEFELAVDCDDLDLVALLEKKKALGSELKRLSVEEPLVPY